MVVEPLKAWLPQLVKKIFSNIWYSDFMQNHVLFYQCIVASNARCKRFHSGRILCHRSECDSRSLYYMFHILRVYCYWFPLGSSTQSRSGWGINWFPLIKLFWLQCFRGFTISFFYVSSECFEVHTIHLVHWLYP